MQSTDLHPLGFKRAVVIGGGIAGLLSARVLSEHFEQVTLLERDSLPAGPEARKGVPQARHVHALLEAGREALEQLFPGLVQELCAEGAEPGDMGRDSAWFHAGAWKARFVSDIRTVLCTRAFLEWKVRGRVATLPGVTLRPECSVKALLADPSRTRVTGVLLEGPGGEEALEAELVVDASGRGSRGSRWLEELGYGRPDVEQVEIDLAYTSCFFERPSSLPDWKVLVVYPRAPEGWRTGVISCVEGGRWLVSLGGYFGQHAPTDAEGFLAFAGSLARPELHGALRDARPLSAPVTHRIPSSRWLHYERMARWPEGFILLGDAVCALNPIYAQGLTVISKGTDLLARMLSAQARATRQGFARRFQRELARVLAMPWWMSTTMDLQYPQARGRRPPGLGLVQRGFTLMLDLTSRNANACRRFYEVMHMRHGLGGLLTPSLLASFIAYSVQSLFVPLERRANVTVCPPAPGGGHDTG
ncbi:FAD-dependent oxidoreductase [Corallococcus sp. CA054B]|uniref:FAD-dependent oxidoreductase n=1 Tax=Corallococcus sp. CA054B TaxID=2316734 RepID=UPI000EA4072E|nr:FAD-dependent oxidoreductase [Corallococcus sp. CA054B]RKG68768.1 FAD-dependent oxidoreductase [Corallococcus sp. CA054B]